MQGWGSSRGGMASHGGSGSPEVWALERASFLLVDVILEDDVTPPGRRVRAAERRTLSPIGPLINHWSDSHIPALDAGRCAGGCVVSHGCGRGPW